MNVTNSKKRNFAGFVGAFLAALSLHGCAVHEPAPETNAAPAAVEAVAPDATDAAADAPAAVVVVPADAQAAVKTPEGVPDAFAMPPVVTTASAPVVTEAKPIAPAMPVYVEPQKWDVSPSDGTIRETLAKWSAIAGYTFNLEHWTVPYDLPVTGSDTMYGDFKTAVRRLIATSELTDSPLQPCFYANHLVRVVPYNQVCNRFTAR